MNDTEESSSLRSLRKWIPDASGDSWVNRLLFPGRLQAVKKIMAAHSSHKRAYGILTRYEKAWPKGPRLNSYLINGLADVSLEGIGNIAVWLGLGSGLSEGK